MGSSYRPNYPPTQGGNSTNHVGPISTWTEMHISASGDITFDGRKFPFGRGNPLPRFRPKLSRGLHLRLSSLKWSRSLARECDLHLERYLKDRQISARFLRDIDFFLEDNAEVLSHASDFVEELNSKRTPLEAYLFFIKGYTRPARYVSGFLIESSATLRDRVPFDLRSNVRGSGDQELIDFFDGYQYRHDVLVQIDTTVDRLVDGLHANVALSPAQCQLICYALFGNASDAYKFYEYNYQSEWLPHRYLPEHVVLSVIPRAEDYQEPDGSTLNRTHPDASSRAAYPWTRLRMVRAKEAGDDIIAVLLDEFAAKLVTNGFRRQRIDELGRETQLAIRNAEQRNMKVDIVDLVMVTADREIARAREVPRNGALLHRDRPELPFTRQLPPKEQQIDTAKLKRILSTYEASKKLLEAALIRESRCQPRGKFVPHPERQVADRSFVNSFVGLARALGKMTSAQATDLQSDFSILNQQRWEKSHKGRRDTFQIARKYLGSLSRPLT